tara:strand:+ start:1994 stop:2146 length:153 start_codon:yes stop_codon:yes gene_type:complete
LTFNPNRIDAVNYLYFTYIAQLTNDAQGVIKIAFDRYCGCAIHQCLSQFS